jgi:DNA primase
MNPGDLIRKARFMGSGPAPEITTVSEPVEVASERLKSDDAHAAENVSFLAAEPPPETGDARIPLPGAAKLKLAGQPATTTCPPELERRWDHEPTTGVPVEAFADGLVISIGERRYRIRGLDKNTSYERLHVNLKVTRLPADLPAGASAQAGGADATTFHQTILDLYDGEKRARFVKTAAAELAVEEAIIKRDIARVLLKLEELQHEQIVRTLQPKEQEVTLTPAEQEAATGFLTAPGLIERLRDAFRRCGMVGEVTNLTVAFLCAVSRLLRNPLGVLVQSSSAAGKTAILEAVLGCTPEESRIKYSALTGQALFYMGNINLRHKVVCIAEEQGAQRATYPLKLLLSEGELSIASTGKDPASGRLVTHEYRVEGPVSLLTSSTAVELDEELQNRCITLAIDESREQTQRIHRQQRHERTVEGIWEREERPEIRKLIQNAQRLLKPLVVFNPFAADLRFVDRQTRTRRDHLKYLTLMDAIALLHQHQRPRKILDRNGKTLECVLVTREDVELAGELANEVFGRFLDELSPQTRRFLLLLHEMVRANAERQKIERQDYRFSRRDIREHTGWSDFQVRAHMEKLMRLEYVLAHHGKRGQSFVYDLVYDGEGQQGEKFMPGLIDPAKLVLSPAEGIALPKTQAEFEHAKPEFEHGNGKFEGSSSIHRASIEPPSSIGGNGSAPLPEKGESDLEPADAENAYMGANGAGSRRARNRALHLAAAGGPDDEE